MKKGPQRPKDPLKSELAKLKKQGVELWLDGQPGTPKEISRACKIAEDGVYMRDYICDGKGDVQKVAFVFVKDKIE